MGKRVALVLGSGGARGYAHIGAIEALEQRGYKIACVAGCSMGAVIGGVYAAGKLPEYRRWIESLAYFDLLKLLDPSFTMGAIRGDKVFGRLREMVGPCNIEDLSIPYTAVACDLTNRQEVWFQEGCLHQAMRASAAIPSLFTPVLQGRRVLVDGGLLNPLPIIPVVSSHCDLIIAVNLNAISPSSPAEVRSEPSNRSQKNWMNAIPWRRQTLKVPTENATEEAAAAVELELLPKSLGPNSLFALVNQSFELMQTSLTQYKMAGYPPDLVINIPRKASGFFDFHKAAGLIELGRASASDALDRYEASLSSGSSIA